MKIIFILSLAMMLISLGTVISPREKRICADFHSQLDAQMAFNKDPIKYKHLDGDKNGVPCETYQYKK